MFREPLSRSPLELPQGQAYPGKTSSPDRPEQDVRPTAALAHRS
jgi:hypothetical protein